MSRKILSLKKLFSFFSFVCFLVLKPALDGLALEFSCDVVCYPSCGFCVGLLDFLCELDGGTV